ncbi:MAG: Flagellar motor switch protein FliM [Frankiales bacterium]|nr:Flagellar motor switch protein FliM [Frankiales bacterium]
MPTASLFDFSGPLPMPAGAGRLVAAVAAATPRVGLLVGLACGRDVEGSCRGVRRAALVEVARPGTVWAPLACGLPEPGLLLIARTDAVALADLLLGGPGEAEDRATSQMEQQLLVRHLVPALQPVVDALADHGVTGLACGPVTDQPLPTGLGEVVAVPVELALPSGATAQITLCLPAKSLLPAETGPAAIEPASATERVLSDVCVDVALRLRSTTVSAEDVEDLAPGDVLHLDPDAVATLLGVLPGGSSGVTVLTASLGRRGKRRAVVVHDLLGGL